MKFSHPLACLLAATAVAGAVVSHAQERQAPTPSAVPLEARKYSFALVGPDGSVSCWGSWQGAELRELVDKAKDQRLYVRKDHVMYVITDKGTLDKTRGALEPMNELGKQQGQLGKQQGELGKQQGELGKQQAVLGQKLGKLGQELAENVGVDAEAEKDILRKMKSLANEQKELGKQQAALGERQRELGKKQGELGRRQAGLAKVAEEKITKLIDAAFERSLAQRVSG